MIKRADRPIAMCMINVSPYVYNVRYIHRYLRNLYMASLRNSLYIIYTCVRTYTVVWSPRHRHRHRRNDDMTGRPRWGLQKWGRVDISLFRNGETSLLSGTATARDLIKFKKVTFSYMCKNVETDYLKATTKKRNKRRSANNTLKKCWLLLSTMQQ